MSTELFDTHCHLNLSDCFPDPEPYFENAQAAEITRMALVGLDIASSRQAIELAEVHAGTFAIVGHHPNYAASYDPNEISELKDMLSHPRAVALGEIGLDFHWDYATREQQERCLFDQLDLALELDMPVVFHCRDAYPQLLDLLEPSKAGHYLFHCFSGTEQDAERAQNLDCHFGFDGPLTYKKSDALRALVSTLPRNRVVLETDSPYLTPEPFRGKPNEPAYLPYVNRALAETWEVGEEDSARTTTENALNFFRIQV